MKGEIDLPNPEIDEDPLMITNLEMVIEKTPKNSTLVKGTKIVLPVIEKKDVKDVLKFDYTFGKKGCDYQIVS